MSPVHYTSEDGIGLLRVSRPEARNALDWEAQAAFGAAVSQAAGDAALRVLIITGAGEKAFVSGGDLRELAESPRADDGARLQQTMTVALARLTTLPVPVLAAVNGDAIGGGAEILTACDLRLAAPHARVRFAQVAVGLSTGWGGGPRLVTLVGLGPALDLLLTGRSITAAEAQTLGLVQQIVTDESVVDAAWGLARRLCALPADALATVKAVAYAAAQPPAAGARRLEEARFLELYGSDNHREALRAFVEKRPPRFNQS